MRKSARPQSLALFYQRSLGFTLLELLVVLVIMGIMLGAVSINSMQSVRQRLQTDAQRVSILLQLAREEAIVRNRPTAFEASREGYQFLVLNDNKWERFTDLETLRERAFTYSDTKLSLESADQNSSDMIRIVFGREPVSKPFILRLQVGADQVLIRGDGVGHFDVE
jgi:general secretion pathway protein H